MAATDTSVIYGLHSSKFHFILFVSNWHAASCFSGAGGTEIGGGGPVPASDPGSPESAEG